MSTPFSLAPPVRRKNDFCSYCGTAFAPAQSFPRRCAVCGATVYLNPTPVAVMVVPVTQHDGTVGVLAVRRDIEPKRGEWALPGGFMEAGESWQESAAREVREETGLVISPAAVQEFMVRSGGPHLLVFGIIAPLAAGELEHFVRTEEVTELTVMTTAQELAFPTHSEALRRFLAGHRGLPR